jgi:type I restriction enzyme S subunit
MGWPRATLGNVIVEAKYGTSVRAASESGGIAVLRMNNIASSGHLDLRDLKYAQLPDEERMALILKQGDLLFNRTNSRELVGKTGLWTESIEAVPASYLIRVRVDRQQVIPEYVWAYMNTRFMKQVLFERARRAIGMANINAQELRSLPFIKPPIETQKEFAQQLASLAPISTCQAMSAECLQTLFSGLLFRAFSSDLTAKWREAHMKELLAEMKEQTKLLAAVRSSN